MSDLDRLIQDELGVQTRPVKNPEIISVGMVATEFLKQNPNRLAFVFVNLSPNVMFILDESSVATFRGIRIGANGGTASVGYKRDYHLVGSTWWVIAGDSSSNLLVIEQVTN